MPKITKDAAARILNTNPRTVERYTKQGRLSATYEKGRTRPVPMFDDGEVRALAEQLKHPASSPMVMPTLTDNADPSVAIRPSQALQTRQGIALGQILLDALQGRQTPGITIPARVSLADLSHKLMLSLPEAARLSGVPIEELRKAAKAGKLKMVKNAGRGFGKVKRTELEAYVRKL